MCLLLHFDASLFIFVYGVSEVLVQFGLVFCVHVSSLLEILDDFPLSIDLLYEPFFLSFLVCHELLVFEGNELNVLDKLRLRF